MIGRGLPNPNLQSTASSAQKYSFSCSTGWYTLRPLQLFEQTPEWAKIEIKIGRREIEVLRQLSDLGFQLHESFPHLLYLLVSQRSSFHAADSLAFEQLTEQFDDAEDQLCQPLFDVLG